MRIKFAKLLTFFIVFINLAIFYFSWKYFTGPETADNQIIMQEATTEKPKDRIAMANKHLKKSLTIVFRDFHPFDNDLRQSINNFVNLIPNIKILIVCDEIPYPPLDIFTVSTGNQSYSTSLIFQENVKFISLSLDLSKNAQDVLSQIKTKYILLLPDSVRLANGRQFLQKLLKELGTMNDERKRILIVPFMSNKRLVNYCFQINVDTSHWTIEYGVRNGTRHCDMYTQKHAILMETSTLKELPEPLSAPFPEYFYVQTKFAQIEKKYSNETFPDGKKLITSYHSKLKRKQLKKEQFKLMYKKLHIKKVIKTFYFLPQKNQNAKAHKKGQNGFKDKNKNTKSQKDNKDYIDVLIEPLDLPEMIFVNSSISSPHVVLKTDVCYFGCEKNTKSCIGQIYNQKPFYLYLNKHTPPCCIEKLKIIFQYMVEELENVGIRYWLDNSALKDAVEINKLSPDAFEIDLSFNFHDFNRSNILKRCTNRPYIVEANGFYCIKSTDGNYFKIQYSKNNQIAVNLMPFELSGDKMKPFGFYGWKAKQIPLEFLHPMSTIAFLGKTVFTPNNLRDYLELKNIK